MGSFSLYCLASATVIAALSGVPHAYHWQKDKSGRIASTVFMTVSGMLGLTGAITRLILADKAAGLGTAPGAYLTLDALSAFFLIPLYLIGTLGAWYGLDYFTPQEPGRSKRLSLFWGLLVSGMSILLLAAHGIVFLFGWELMAVSAFMLIAIEEENPDHREAARIFLLASHFSTLCLFGLFAFWQWNTGSYFFQPFILQRGGFAAVNAFFLLALLGFGLKAGVVPLHFWLPSAHASAPSHVSALLSGVMLKMGIYGLLRVLVNLPDLPFIWGWILLVLGCVSALLGVAFAIAQHDIKRLLAYHSVENIGIIVMGLGLALIGKSRHETEWIWFGYAAALLHVWNHGLFKSLLFLGAGAVIRAEGTREIDRLGGLAKFMPWTGFLFLVGAVAICGLPPLNGFVSEFLLYRGFLSAMNSGFSAFWGIVMAFPVLATVGALALICFVKVLGSVFLGTRRADSGTPAEAPFSMLVPMAIIAVICLWIGVQPGAFIGLLSGIEILWTSAEFPVVPAAATEPLETVAVFSIVATLLIVMAVGASLWIRRKKQPEGKVLTWDCGYARPTPRMQYTASSFATMVVSAYRVVLRPQVERPNLREIFPGESHVKSHVNELILDRIVLPAARSFQSRLERIHRLQHGLVQHYLMYILITVLVMLALLMPIQNWLELGFAS